MRQTETLEVVTVAPMTDVGAGAWIDLGLVLSRDGMSDGEVFRTLMADGLPFDAADMIADIVTFIVWSE